jgi:hypothetical protein
MDSKQAYEARRKANLPWRAWYKTSRWQRIRAAQLVSGSTDLRDVQEPWH